MVKVAQGPGWSRGWVVAWAAGFTALALGQEPAQDPGPKERLEKLQAAGPKAAIALLPAIVMEKGDRNVADVLGLTLEKVGLEDLAVSDTAFVPPAGTTWEQWPAAVAEFVRQSPPAAAYVLLAEYVGTPQTGPKEVRFVIVDREGGVVLADRQTPADADFKRTAAADPDPMGCSVLVAERVRKLMKLPAVAGGTRDGKFAKLWAEKSGTASDDERAAMKKAQAQLKATLREAALVIFPTRINGEVDAAAAGHLAGALAQEFGCQARVADKPFQVEIAPSTNQQRRLWDLARAFRAHVRDGHPDAEYALIADYLMAPSGKAGGVHFVICSRLGEWVVVDFQNDQQADFKAIGPKSADDCDRLVAKRLASYVR